MYFPHPSNLTQADISLSKLLLYRKFWTEVMLMSATAVFIWMWKNTPKTTTMGNSVDGIYRILLPKHANWTDRQRKSTVTILLYGKRLLRNILCIGRVRGQKVSLDGTWSVQQWVPNTSEKNLISMEVAWT